MNKESNQEDRVILAVWDRLSPDPESAREEAALTREYTELVGLLPYELEPAAPPAEAWEGIRSRLSVTAPSVVPFPQPRESRVAPRKPARRWGSMAMAAALAVCLVGVGYLLTRTQLQQSTIDRLTADLDTAAAQEILLAQDIDQFEMITRVARHIYPMRPVATPAAQKPMTGNVFVCGQHQQWYLNVQGMGPPPADHEYLLWFVTDEGMVMGGTVTIQGGDAELAAPSMPVGTRGFVVTMERRDTPHDEPHGTVLLRGDAPFPVRGSFPIKKEGPAGPSEFLTLASSSNQKM